jgi:hypothetical protein
VSRRFAQPLPAGTLAPLVPALVACALLAAAAFPGLARADAYHTVFNAYTRAGDVPACRFSSATLAAAYREAQPDDVQYFGDFRDAIQRTLAFQATGYCNSAAARRAVALGGPVAPSLRGPALPGSVTAATGAGVPAPLVLVLGIAGAFALLGLGAGVVRMRGWDPAWAVALRHSWNEAEYRIAGTWAEFRDWLRSA